MFDPTLPAQTRGGQDVRILSTDASGLYNIVYETEDAKSLHRVSRAGFLISSHTPSQFDLVNKPEELTQLELFLNVGHAYGTANGALKDRGMSAKWPVIKVVAMTGKDGVRDIREIVSTEVIENA